MSSLEDTNSAPELPFESPGSSVSTGFQDEYEELLKYAVVIPDIDMNMAGKTLTDYKNSFPQYAGSPQSTPRQQNTRKRFQQEVETVPSDIASSEDDLQGRQSAGVLNEMSDRMTGRTPGQPFTSTSNKLQQADTSTLAPPGGFLADLVDSPGSSADDSNVSEAHEPGVDGDILQMEHLLDFWSGDLKRNVLDFLAKMKLRMMHKSKEKLVKESSVHKAISNQQQNEIEGLKELLNTYEQSIERKDQVISNLTRGLQQQKEKHEMARALAEWKMRYNDLKREQFATKLAHKHHNKTLKQQVWDGWHSLVEGNWRRRVEGACQNKAQEVCMSLTNDYEAKIASLNEALEAARKEVNRLHEEREKYEETMKKAFMRGVCALNLEAMTMFNEGEQGDGRLSPGNDENRSPRIIPQEPVYTTDRLAPHQGSRVITSLGAGGTNTTSTISQSRSSVQAKSKPGSGKGRVFAAKVTARGPEIGRGGQVTGTALNPPMSSVLVERHHPITKQTIGHAVASRFPATSQGSLDRKQVPGKAGSMHLIAPNIHSVKVVQ